MLQHMAQEVEFQGSQGKLLSLKTGNPPAREQDDVPQLQVLAVFLLLAGKSVHPAEQGLDPGDQLQRKKRLHQIVVTSQSDPGDPVQRRVLGRNDNDRHMTLLPDPGTYGQPVHSRHHHVQDTEIRHLLLAGCQDRFPVLKASYLKALFFQKILDQKADIFFIVSHVDPFCHWHSSFFQSRLLICPSIGHGTPPGELYAWIPAVCAETRCAMV